MMDWIGRATLVEDAESARSLVTRGLEWLFQTPWWAPATLATLLTVSLIWRLREAPPQIVPAISREDGKIDPWAAHDTPTFVELHLAVAEFRAKTIASSNVFDTTVSLLGGDKTKLEVVVIFDRWIVSRNAAITCDNRLDGYLTSVQKITDRYLICQVINVGSPAVIRIECS